MISPESIFDHPSEVASAIELTKQQKLEILHQWETDARALQRATDENMQGGKLPPLDAIHKALSTLDPGNTADSDIGKGPANI